LAHRYTRVLLGWLRDLTALGQLSPGDPLEIVELGCGTGRFTFHMLRALEEVEASPVLHSLKWSYLATDISEKRLQSLTEKRPLKRFFSENRLHTTFYDVLNPDASFENKPRGPLVVIANYVLDSLPADCFRVQSGKLFETRIALREEDSGEGLEGISWDFSHHPIELPYYDDAELDEMLGACQGSGDSRTILLPTGAVRALRNLRKLTNRPLLILIADKTLEGSRDTAGNSSFLIELHGDSHFSIPLDIEFLRKSIKASGGQMAFTSHGQEVIHLAACMYGVNDFDFLETRLSFRDEFEAASLTSALYTAARLREQVNVLSLHDHLAYLRAVHYDPSQWSSIFPLFFAKASTTPPELKRELIEALDKMAARWYPSVEGGLDMPFLIGCTYLHIGEAEKAQKQFADSMEEFGSRPAVLFQAGRAEFRLGERSKGASTARAAYRADPALGGFLERLGVLPGGDMQARQIIEQMEWEASLPG
jgi:SAM-dependent methyltransferase